MLTTPVGITVSLTISPQPDASDSPHDMEVTLEVNGTHVTSRDHAGSTPGTVVTQAISADLLTAGENTIRVRAPKDGKPGFLVNQLSVSSEAVQVTAQYYWHPLPGGMIYQNMNGNVQETYATGTTATKTETISFAETVGGSVTAGSLSEILGGISASLNFSITATQSMASAIALSVNETQQETYTFNVPEGATALAYQVWQLCIAFVTEDASNGDSPGLSLVQQGNILIPTQAPNSD